MINASNLSKPLKKMWLEYAMRLLIKYFAKHEPMGSKEVSIQTTDIVGSRLDARAPGNNAILMGQCESFG